MCQETQGDTITNMTVEPVHLHCSHHNLNVSVHDGRCLRSSESVATNYSCFVSAVLCFYQRFFFMAVSINNIVVANVSPPHVESTDGDSK